MKVITVQSPQGQYFAPAGMLALWAGDTAPTGWTFKSALDEIFWIWQKKSNNVADLNSRIWDSWADDKGTIFVGAADDFCGGHDWSDSCAARQGCRYGRSFW